MAEEIPSHAQAACPVCGERGDVVLDGLRDKLFGVPGRWAARRCSNAACGSLFVDPAIDESQLYRAYERYFTHDDVAEEDLGALEPATAHARLDALAAARYASRFGYETAAPLWALALTYLLPLVKPSWKTQADADVMYLHAVPGGRLLDVGCGSGGRLLLMRDLGWSVRGVELDEEAVRAARSRGLDVDQGDLRDAAYEAESFDAVTLSHVIEHVPDPRSLMREVHRVLKPGGSVAVVTPNAASWGARRYGRCWRGLEPPRHLQVFTPSALKLCALEAGFHGVRAWSVASPYVLSVSHGIARGGEIRDGDVTLRGVERLHVKALALLEHFRLPFFPEDGEFAVLTASRAAVTADIAGVA